MKSEREATRTGRSYTCANDTYGGYVEVASDSLPAERMVSGRIVSRLEDRWRVSRSRSVLTRRLAGLWNMRSEEECPRPRNALIKELARTEDEAVRNLGKASDCGKGMRW